VRNGEELPADDPAVRPLSLRPDALDWVDSEGEIVVLDAERSVYLSLNASGATMWRMLAEGTTRYELIGVLENFAGTPDRAEQDVDAFLERLEGLGLLAGRDG
jgi:hypothetical protein